MCVRYKKIKCDEEKTSVIHRHKVDTSIRHKESKEENPKTVPQKGIPWVPRYEADKLATTMSNKGKPHTPQYKIGGLGKGKL